MRSKKRMLATVVGVTVLAGSLTAIGTPAFANDYWTKSNGTNCHVRSYNTWGGVDCFGGSGQWKASLDCANEPDPDSGWKTGEGKWGYNCTFKVRSASLTWR